MEVLKFVHIISNLGDNEQNGTIPNATCDTQRIPNHSITFGAALPGVLIPIFLGLFVQRSSACPNSCNRRPGLVYPMNVLDSRHNRIPFILAFGVIAPNLMAEMFGRESSLTGSLIAAFSVYSVVPSWAKALIKIFSVVIIGTAYYPVFCIISLESIIGYVLGFILCGSLLGIELYNWIVCLIAYDTGDALALTILTELPSLICLLILCGFFPYLIIRKIRGGNLPHENAKIKEKEMMENYVTDLLKVNKQQTTGFAAKLEEMDVVRKKGFYFPPLLLCSLMIAALVLYLFVLEMYVSGLTIFKFFDKIFAVLTTVNQDERPMQEVFDSIRSNTTAPAQMLHDVAKIVHYCLYIGKACFLTAASLSLVATIIHFPFILINFRRNILQAYKGKYPIVRPPRSMDPISTLTGFTLYCAYQAAYLTWGFVITFALFLIIFLFLGLGIIIPLMYGFGQFWLSLLHAYWPYILILVIILVIRRITIQFCFIQKPRTFLGVDNRKVFFIWLYYLFFYNMFIGAVSAIVRILKTLVVGVLFIGRVDFPVMPKLFENLDPGFFAYCGYIITEVEHNNPILRTFVNILLDNCKKRQDKANEYCLAGSTVAPVQTSYGEENIILESNAEATRRQIRFKWHLLYTLHSNSILRYERKHILREERDSTDKTSDGGSEQKTILDGEIQQKTFPNESEFVQVKPEVMV